MPIHLEQVNTRQIIGIYPPPNGTLFPIRFGYLYPAARECFLLANSAAGSLISLSDMFRSARASYKGKYPKGNLLGRRGVLRPAHSAHNYGLAIDVAVGRTLRNLTCTKRCFDEYMAHYGWYCHRRDHKRRSEEWHYNFLGLGRGVMSDEEKTSAGAVERRIRRLYEKQWLSINPKILLDGKKVKAFQKEWKLKVDGIAGPKTKRLLWFLQAEADFIKDSPLRQQYSV